MPLSAAANAPFRQQLFKSCGVLMRSRSPCCAEASSTSSGSGPSKTPLKCGEANTNCGISGSVSKLSPSLWDLPPPVHVGDGVASLFNPGDSPCPSSPCVGGCVSGNATRSSAGSGSESIDMGGVATTLSLVTFCSSFSCSSFSLVSFGCCGFFCSSFATASSCGSQASSTCAAFSSMESRWWRCRRRSRRRFKSALKSTSVLCKFCRATCEAIRGVGSAGAIAWTAPQDQR
mmetsp:Transcript_96011/g.222565  ORF Transcript_96011/g.222565 Transcript_96011/m.222565 type:complete len:232 (+) Transcript_96011:112-807(+)